MMSSDRHAARGHGGSARRRARRRAARPGGRPRARGRRPRQQPGPLGRRSAAAQARAARVAAGQLPSAARRSARRWSAAAAAAAAAAASSSLVILIIVVFVVLQALKKKGIDAEDLGGSAGMSSRRAAGRAGRRASTQLKAADPNFSRAGVLRPRERDVHRDPEGVGGPQHGARAALPARAAVRGARRAASASTSRNGQINKLDSIHIDRITPVSVTARGRLRLREGAHHGDRHRLHRRRAHRRDRQPGRARRRQDAEDVRRVLDARAQGRARRRSPTRRSRSARTAADRSPTATTSSARTAAR